MMGTTTTLSYCGNYVCEFLIKEDQNNCPIDCNTNLEMFTPNNNLVSPNTFLNPKQDLTLVLAFNDSRYNSTQGYNMKMVAIIDDQMIWNGTNGCTVCNKTLKEMGCSQCGNSGFAGGEWHVTYYPINVHMENSYGKIVFNATLPYNIAPGLHTVKITPVLYSRPLTLRSAEASINISDGLYTFVSTVKSIFDKLTDFLALQ